MKDAEQDVRAILKHEYVREQVLKLNEEGVREALREYGTWDDLDLRESHAENVRRMVWIAAGNVREDTAEERKAAVT